MSPRRSYSVGLRHAWEDDRGQSLVEFALASVVFFMTIFGILELGLAVSRYNMVADLAQEGARWASVRGTASSGGPSNQAAVQTFVQSRSSGLNPAVSISPSPIGAPGSTITVTVTSAYSPMTGFIARTAQIPLSATATMVVSR